MRPATDLPWRIFSSGDTLEISPPEPSGLGERPAIVFWQGFDGNGLGKRANSKNAAYIVHACNSYHKLVEALRLVVLKGGERDVKDARLLMVSGEARALLRELGESYEFAVF